ncbi:hypothetical protein OIE61_39775 [Streptomyces sp. NBC_01762]|uniref:hypothetical protein n=1 Tax=unclassified Streptomyces TaxID=2593676 RepID=UPI002DDC0A8F|nr:MULTISPECIES: hypothetical protein [unclassified Streptomyces]WSC49564.1 hypothetical protein OIE61_39775 [Streptomyces sp. NBC_01762]WSD29137.1 hypothetical protein OHA26_40090 [Streptomyces sp. NBC_01751]
MTHPVLAFGAASDLPLLLAAVVPAALAVVLIAWTIRRRGTRPQNRLGGPAVKVAAVAALGCTAYSADTSWRFATDYLDMAGTAERAGMFAAAELALFATALMARQNLASQGASGLPGTLVWVITTVQVIPAYAESGPVGGTVRAFVGPVMAAMLWHLAMGIELRLRTPGAASHGLIAVLGREARERLLSRLGIAARDRDAAQITRDRATARAVALAARLAERTPDQQRNRNGRRLTRRLSKAVGRASVGTDPLQRAQLLDQLAARRHALALATVPLPSPWSPAHSSASAAPVSSQPTVNAPVPAPGLHGPDERDSDRGPGTPRGPVPEGAYLKAQPSAGTEGDEMGTTAGTSAPEGGAVPGTGPADPEAAERHTAATGTDRATREVAAQGPDSHRGPSAAESGTETTGDRGHKVHLRRKTTTTPRTKNKAKRARSRSSRTQRPVRELDESERQLVRDVRPHVPALLARDGNEAITRVQLREIIRSEGLMGVGNDRITFVLRELRNDDITTTRSTAR